MGGDKQVTIMVLKVDLECNRCYKKIKKVLCKFPQVQDQVYDEKANTVTIKVICCNPYKIKQKIKCKGGDIIKCIEIKPPPEKTKPLPPETPKPPPEKPKQPPPVEPREPENLKPPPEKPKTPPEKPPPAQPVVQICLPQGGVHPTRDCCPDCYAGRRGGPCFYGCVPVGPPPPEKRPPAQPVVPICLPQGEVHPTRDCCPDCYAGRPGGPCFYGCVPVGPPPCYQYDGYYGRPVYNSYSGGRSYYASRCDYFYEENAGACAIM